jgi:alpha-tubulin suppressor-like RCC1 family protein
MQPESRTCFATRWLPLCLILCTLAAPSSHAARRSPEIGARVPGTRISAGTEHACAIKEDGTVRCWGANFAGQIGDGTTVNRSQPVQVLSIGSVVSVAAGTAHTCALRATGTVACWGNNASGQLGDGTTNQRTVPVDVAGLSNVKAIAAGSAHTCALAADGAVRCWGANVSGQLGNGSTSSAVLTPVAVLNLSGIAAISAGHAQTCALASGGLITCWGDNTIGQLGDGTTTSRPSPGTIVAGFKDAVAIGSGGDHTCALRATGALMCWGDNYGGQLGDGTAIDRPLPVTVTGVAGAVAVAATSA